MSAPRCEREAQVAAALRSGAALGEALRAHVSACAACRQTQRVAAYLQALARQGEADTALPEPGALFRRARLLERLLEQHRSAEQATRPLLVAEALAFPAAGALLLMWIGSGWARVSERLAAWQPSWIEAASLVGLPAAAVTQGLFVAVLTCLTLLLAFPLLASED
jgi:hypothetical protein